MTLSRVIIEQKAPVGENGVSKFKKQTFKVPKTIVWNGKQMTYDPLSAGYYDNEENFVSVFELVADSLGEKLEADADEKE